MKQILIVTVISSLLASCAKVDVLYTSPYSNDIKEDSKGHWVYENDTIRVTYAFWSEKGVMAMVIENKLNIPLYIDWKKSAFLDKRNKFNYYSENLTTKSVTASTSANYLYRGIFNWDYWYPVNLGASVSNGTIEKQERITFLPPHSQARWATYKLLPVQSINVKNTSKEYIEVVGRKRKLPVYVTEASKDNANVIFGNFLTYSTKENFESERYIDNQFFVNKMMQVKGFWFIESQFQDAKRFWVTDGGE